MRPALVSSTDTTAFDCTATLPLVNSLNHFAYLASTSPRIREMATLDGGLERLIHILRRAPRSLGVGERDGTSLVDMQANWKWTLAFQCVVNIGVRGSETIRTRVVEAGMVPVIIRVLDSYLQAADQIYAQQQHLALSMREPHVSPQLMQRTIYPTHDSGALNASAAGARPASPMDTNASSAQPPANSEGPSETDAGRRSRESMRSLFYGADASANASASASASECNEEVDVETVDMDEAYEPKPTANESETSSAPAHTTPRADMAHADVTRTPRAARQPTPTPASTPTPPTAPPPVMPPVFREEEVLLSLQLLAYLSKYPNVRLFFHNANVRETMIFCPEWPEVTLPNRSWQPSDPPLANVFSVAERFTHRPSRSTGASSVLCSLYPRLAPDIQYWAGVVMRNACRKDESRGGIRQCANMLCGKWESYPREFAKCRRCRKAKYCSKQCQSKGWQMGHRFWCSARSEEDKARSNAAAAAVAPPIPMQEEVPAPAPEPSESPAADTLSYASHYVRPLGARQVPSTFAEAPALPPLRGVSAASAVSTDSADVVDSDDGTTRYGESSAMPSPTADSAQPPRPPPIIAGDLPVHDTDPATATVRAQETQHVQANNALEYVAASWPPVVSPPEPAAHAHNTTYDLGIRVPDQGAPAQTPHQAEESTPTPFSVASWHMAPSVALRSVHHAARAVSSMLAGTPSAGHRDDPLHAHDDMEAHTVESPTSDSAFP